MQIFPSNWLTYQPTCCQPVYLQGAESVMTSWQSPSLPRKSTTFYVCKVSLPCSEQSAVRWAPYFLENTLPITTTHSLFIVRLTLNTWVDRVEGFWVLGQMVASVAGSYRASLISTERPVGWPLWDKRTRCVCVCVCVCVCNIATLTTSAG